MIIISQFLTESLEEQTALDVKTHQDQIKKGEKKEEKVLIFCFNE